MSVGSRPLAALVMAAGLGRRMRSSTPKHLHPLLGRRLVDWVVEAARPLAPDPLVLVTSPESRDAVADIEGVDVVVQEQPLGTGDAVASARSSLAAHSGDLLVLSGDTPLLTSELLEALVSEHRQSEAAVTLLSFRPDDPGAYGRVVRNGDGGLTGVVEATEASPEELAVGEANSSIYVFAADALWSALERLDPHNAQGELYLTDCIGPIIAAGGSGAVLVSPDVQQPLGVNTRGELATAAAALRDRINEQHMLAGVTIVDPGSTWIEAGVEIEADVTIHPFTAIRGNVRIAGGVEIGPFAYVRPGTEVGQGAKLGTFVEIKNARIGDRAKVPHLSYIGDADIGEDTNVAAGNITANYRPELGPGKQRTTIGRNVRTGVDNAFIAPVTIGDNAWVAAGSVITDDVPADALAVARARQENKEGYARGKRHD
jgi:bifunctional UDP-N-acetylglucosamine pyrophosphorylase/glucosamine-1-phosphate N-acetyltransferase